MQATHASSRILQPANPWFIRLSLLAALLLNFLPTSSWLWIPDWVALTLVFWCVREPRYVGMGYAFLFGLAMDVADASLMGQHALAYVIIAYLAMLLSRRILWFSLGQQALHALPLLLIAPAVQLAVRLPLGVEFPGLPYFAGPCIAAALWPLLTFILLLPQYQPIERDANRPI